MSKIFNPVLPFSTASDTEISAILQENSLALTVEEAKKIAGLLGRNPTLTEAVIWNIQGSEHSSYKSSKKLLRRLPVDATPVILGPKEDAGIVELCEIRGEKFGIVYSHESHNSPSQVVPFEGAATGVGGICRDIACMGAKVIGVLDALRFGDEKKPQTSVLAKGVVSGIAGYGNPLGVPNLGGDIFFDDSFDGFTLVNVVALGLVKEKNILHSFVPKDAAEKKYELIVVGKASDRSGFGGASFSSAVLNENDKEKNVSAVQEPNPFLERHLLASFADLFVELEKMGELQNIAFKDMGAGGIMCASVELADGADFGAEIFVENIHTGEDGLPPHIILCSETQERFCFGVPPHLTQFFLDHFNKKWDLPNVSVGAKASKVGHITADGIYKVSYNGEKICEAKARDITEGLLIDRPMVMPEEILTEKKLPENLNLSEFLPKFFASVNIADTVCVHENYDQTVQGKTVLERSVADAAVMAPLRDEKNLSDEEKKWGFAVAVAGSVRLGKISAFEQGAKAVADAISKVAAVGAFPVALTDCLNYGNPEVPEEMGKLVSGVDGVAFSAKNIHLFEFPTEPTPFVSGNVSLYKRGNPSAIVSCVGRMKNSEHAKKNVAHKNTVVVLLGNPTEKIGGSEMAGFLKMENSAPYATNPAEIEKNIFTLLEAHQKHLIFSASFSAEGGFLTTLLKKCVRGNVGFSGNLEKFSNEQLFSEGNSFVLGIVPENLFALEKLLQKNAAPYTILGNFTEEKIISTEKFSVDFEVLQKSWKEGLRKAVFS